MKRLREPVKRWRKSAHKLMGAVRNSHDSRHAESAHDCTCSRHTLFTIATNRSSGFGTNGFLYQIEAKSELAPE